MKKTTFLTLGQWQTKIRIDGYSKSLHLTFVVKWKISKMKYNGRISCMSFLSLTHKWIQCQKQCSISLWSSFPWNHTRTNRTQSSHHAIRQFHSFLHPSLLSFFLNRPMNEKKTAPGYDSSHHHPPLQRQIHLSLPFQLQLHLHLHHPQLQNSITTTTRTTTRTTTSITTTTTSTTTAFKPLRWNHHQPSNMARWSLKTRSSYPSFFSSSTYMSNRM